MLIEVYSPTIRRKEMDAVLTAMVEDRIGPGEQAKFLVQTAKDKIKFDYCLALRSPAIALYLALKSLGLEPGQGVIVSALSPLYYARVISDLGLFPYYCDVLPSTTCLGKETVERVLAAKTEGNKIGCIVLYHSLGFAPDGHAIAELGIPIIDDCSQSFGTVMAADADSAAITSNITSNNAEDATADTDAISAFSAGVFTILGLEERDMLTSGGGALLYAMNRRDAAALRAHADLPPEYGLPDMNAALAVVQFREAAKNMQKRKEIAALYLQSAMRTRHTRFITKVGEYNNYAFPLILETGMNEVKSYARKKEIAVENAFHYTLAGSGIITPEQCPESYSLSLRTVLFPLYPRLKMNDAGKIARLILTLP